MMIISFAWTTPALLAGAKSVTRREWKPSHAAGFHAGDVVAAWDRSPRVGGKKVGEIQLLRDPYREWSDEIARDEWFAEGFGHMTKIGEVERCREIWADWHAWHEQLWVVRFELL